MNVAKAVEQWVLSDYVKLSEYRSIAFFSISLSMPGTGKTKVQCVFWTLM